MDLYCDQDLSITFPTPTKNVVNAYITDLPQLDYLPPCAQSALSIAVMGAVCQRPVRRKPTRINVGPRDTSGAPVLLSFMRLVSVARVTL